MVTAARKIGAVTTSSQLTVAPATVKIGARRQAMPGARRVWTVATRSIAIISRPRVTIPVEVIHTSTPLLGAKASSEKGGSGLMPVSGGVKSRAAYRTPAPRMNSQRPVCPTRGSEVVRLPICIGHE